MVLKRLKWWRHRVNWNWKPLTCSFAASHLLAGSVWEWQKGDLSRCHSQKLGHWELPFSSSKNSTNMLSVRGCNSRVFAWIIWCIQWVCSGKTRQAPKRKISFGQLEGIIVPSQLCQWAQTKALGFKTHSILLCLTVLKKKKKSIISSCVFYLEARKG